MLWNQKGMRKILECNWHVHYILFYFILFWWWLAAPCCRISVPRPTIEPRAQGWKHQIITTRPPGNSQHEFWCQESHSCFSFSRSLNLCLWLCFCVVWPFSLSMIPSRPSMLSQMAQLGSFLWLIFHCMDCACLIPCHRPLACPVNK